MHDSTHHEPPLSTARPSDSVARTVCPSCGYRSPWSDAAAAHVQLSMCPCCFATDTQIETSTFSVLVMANTFPHEGSGKDTPVLPGERATCAHAGKRVL